MLRCVVVHINAAGEESSPGRGASVRVRCSVGIYRNMELHLEFDSDPDVRAWATLSFRLMVRHDRR